MDKLTTKEEQIMQALWLLRKAFVKEIRETLPDPKPHYNTISTIVRILEEKGFVSHESFGKSHRYFPLISQTQYKRSFLKDFVNNYFADSYKEMVSFFAKDEVIDEDDLEEILNMIHKNKTSE